MSATTCSCSIYAERIMNNDRPASVSLDSGDPFLAILQAVALRSSAPNSKEGVGFTAFIGGGALSGTLITHEVWEALFLRQASECSQVVADSLRQELAPLRQERSALRNQGALPASGWVCLKDASFWNGTYSLPVPLWRGRTDQLNGWSLGEWTRQGRSMRVHIQS